MFIPSTAEDLAGLVHNPTLKPKKKTGKKGTLTDKILEKTKAVAKAPTQKVTQEVPAPPTVETVETEEPEAEEPSSKMPLVLAGVGGLAALGAVYYFFMRK